MIRKATVNDLKSVRMSVYNKKIDYITTESVKEDILLGRLYLLVEDGKVLGQCALKYQTAFGAPYFAIQRMVLYNKNNKGHHMADQFFVYFKSLNLGKLGVTPWHDNEKMKYILSKHNFTFQYSIDKHFEFWSFGG